LPSVSRGASSRRQSARDAAWEMDSAAAAHPGPGIQIIQATPKSSPCPSERTTHGNGGSSSSNIKMLDRFKRKRYDDNSIDSITEYPDDCNHQYRSSVSKQSDNNNVGYSNSNTHQNNKALVSSDNVNVESINEQQQQPLQQPQVIRRAPLASLSSFKMSSADCVDSENINGSVFDDDSCAEDTDDDLEQFSTDSDVISLTSPPASNQHVRGEGRKKAAVVVASATSADHANDESVVVVVVDDDEEEERTPSRSPATVTCAASNRNVDDGDVKNNKLQTTNSVGLSPSESIERQRSNDTIRPASYSGCSSSNASIKKTNSSECVTINVVELKQKTNNDENEKSSLKPSTPSSSVILEMPVLAKQNELNNPGETTTPTTLNPDPSVPCQARKWSKETLF